MIIDYRCLRHAILRPWKIEYHIGPRAISPNQPSTTSNQFKHLEAIAVAGGGGEELGDLVDYTDVAQDVLRATLPDSAESRGRTHYPLGY